VTPPAEVPSDGPKLTLPLGPTQLEVSASSLRGLARVFARTPLVEQVKLLPHHAHLTVERPAEGEFVM
jgi:hypothetical protein